MCSMMAPAVTTMTSVSFYQLIVTLWTTAWFLSNETCGFTHLYATLNESCIGEEVIFSCETAATRIRWKVTLNNRRISSESHSFYANTDVAGSSYTESTTNGVPLRYELVSNSMGTLNSTLTVQTSVSLDNAEIECEGTNKKVHRFKLAGVPPEPINITLIRTTYNMTSTKVKLSWSQLYLGTSRVDFYIVNITYYQFGSILTSAQAAGITVEGIPYDHNVTIMITSVNCYSENEGDSFIINIHRCTKTAPLNGHLISGSPTMDTSIPGEEVVFTCNPGYSLWPQVHTTAICQEGGMWSPDINDILCLIECPLPNLHDFVEIANETINGTVLGSNIHLRCTHDLSLSTNLQPATCTKDGEWIPNPEKYTCQAKESNSTITLIASCAAGGILLCLLIVVCLLCACVIKLGKTRSIESSREFDLRKAEPVYETIVGPAYAGICRETELMSCNDAYNFHAE